ncbi:hypothetical protein [Flavobacterium sp.]|uniref:hypothetical protein n=1 Tax=Flavobacterium sp. TaxID=239 RepID=UPI0039192DA3
MKKSIATLVVLLSSLLFTNCNSENDSTSAQIQPEKFVKKMLVTGYNDYSEPIFVGTFEFFYDENKQVSHITKNVTSTTGNLIESNTYNYSYLNDKITSYSITNGNTNEVTYDGNQLLNIGYGNNLEYYTNGNLRKDRFGNELVYQDNNVTGFISNPTLYSYDDKKNPFFNHNPYFKIIFDDQFEAYYYRVIAISANNVLIQNYGSNYSNIIQYENLFPTEIKRINVNSNYMVEKINFEYVSL